MSVYVNRNKISSFFLFQKPVYLLRKKNRIFSTTLFDPEKAICIYNLRFSIFTWPLNSLQQLTRSVDHGAHLKERIKVILDNVPGERRKDNNNLKIRMIRLPSARMFTSYVDWGSWWSLYSANAKSHLISHTIIRLFYFKRAILHNLTVFKYILWHLLFY